MKTDLITLELAAKTKVGTITTNARALLEQVKAGVAKYLAEDYEPDEKTAKDDRATLNKINRAIDEERKRVEAAYNAPLRDFQKACKEIKETIGEAVEIIAGAVEAYEDRRKLQKRGLIEKMFAAKKFSLLPLDRIFDPRWLNKTYRLEDVDSALSGIIERVCAGLKTIEGLSEYAVIAKSKYLDTLDLSGALAEVQKLKDNAERLAAEQAERGKREEERAERELAERESVSAADALAAAEKPLMDLSEPEGPAPQEETFTFTFTFTATAEKCRALRRYMLDSGIEYEKIDMGLYELKAAF
jgi:hypothetical protein